MSYLFNSFAVNELAVRQYHDVTFEQALQHTDVIHTWYKLTFVLDVIQISNNYRVCGADVCWTVFGVHNKEGYIQGFGNDTKTTLSGTLN